MASPRTCRTTPSASASPFPYSISPRCAPAKQDSPPPSAPRTPAPGRLRSICWLVGTWRWRTWQATARYQSGLGTIDQVAEAQRLLTQAEIDDALARLGVWRGLLGLATAAGDIQPFLAEVGQ